MRYRWRVTVMSPHKKRRHILLVSTDSPSARDANRVAVKILESWPLGHRVVRVEPYGPEVWSTDDQPPTERP